MLPAILHIKSLKQPDNLKGPIVLILNPYQPQKEDIYAATKDYVDAAEAKCYSLYDYR